MRHEACDLMGQYNFATSAEDQRDLMSPTPPARSMKARRA